MANLDLVLRNSLVAANDVLECAGEHVDAAHDEHVVGAAQYTSLEPQRGATTGAAVFGGHHAIAGSVAKQWHAPAAEIREHELTRRAGWHGLESLWVDHFGDELDLVDVQVTA